MAGLGRKEWSPGDTLNAADVNGYLMDQSVMVFAGTAERGSAIPSPSAGMVAYSTATQLQVYDGSAWVDLSTGYGVATGGSSSSITIGGINYTLLTFTSDGTLTITKAGLFDYLVIGSGGGSNRPFNGGGGGGGGQLIQGTTYLDTNQSVTIGAGGALNGVNTGISRIGSGIFAMCGGGSHGAGGPSVGSSGAGGHGAGGTISGASAFLNAVTGYGGGTNSTTAPNYPGGGGGGMAGAGGNASGGTGGNAGAGISNSFNGVATTYCRGGFGGIASGGTSNAAANTGNGGADVLNGNGAGGSGLVMVRFKV
jgi:hypothetical protein